MAGRLTRKRVQALLDVAGRGEDELAEDILQQFDEDGVAMDERSAHYARQLDQLLVDYREARAILWQRYLSPKPEPREPDEVLPGFE